MTEEQNSTVSYGTHTLPKEFWTTGVRDPDKHRIFQVRKQTKNARRLRDNQPAKREANRDRSHRSGR